MWALQECVGEYLALEETALVGGSGAMEIQKLGSRRRAGLDMAGDGRNPSACRKRVGVVFHL
jgi:hypothetical protein